MHPASTPVPSQARPLAPAGALRPVVQTTALAPLVLPARRIDRAWMVRRRVRLDPVRHPSVSASTAVSRMVGAVTENERARSGRSSVPSPRPVLHPARHQGVARRWAALPAGRTGRAASGAARETGDTVVPAARRASDAQGQVPRPRSGAGTPTRAGDRMPRLIGLAERIDEVAGHAPGHALRTAFLALRLASALGLRDSEHYDLLHAALFKDAGRLAAARDAGESAAAFLQRVGAPDGVVGAVGAFGERWDGRGTEGWVGPEIPVTARILAVAEAAHRGGAGRAPGSAEAALRSARGRTLDPTIVDLLIDMGRLGLWQEVAAPVVWDERMRDTDDAAGHVGWSPAAVLPAYLAPDR